MFIFTCVVDGVQGENIINIELDMPNRTTRDYESPTVAPKVQAALDAALQEDDDLDIDGGYVHFSSLEIHLFEKIAAFYLIHTK